MRGAKLPHHLLATGFLLSASLLLNSCMTPATTPPLIRAGERLEEAQAQRRLSLQTRLKNTKRIADIGFRLKQANAALCPRTRHTYGFGVHGLQQYEGEVEAAAKALYGFSEYPKIYYVTVQSPAQKAGLMPGDEVLALNKRPLGKDRKAMKRFLKALNAKDGSAITLQVKRAEQSITLSIQPTKTCDIPINISPSSAINARANGRSVVINDGMLRFAKTDEELALIIGHEMAHNTMGHIPAEGSNIGIGMLGGLLLDAALISVGIITPGLFSQAGASAGYLLHSPSFEREADYVGSYYLARAGYPFEQVEGLWRRMGARNPTAIDERSTHPPTAIRFLSLAKTADEITKKRNAGEPLIPKLKPGRALPAID